MGEPGAVVGAAAMPSAIEQESDIGCRTPEQEGSNY
jgi:hypothetical protein